VRRQFFTWREDPRIPVEFSAAAYRFGHSMVRDAYAISDSRTVALFGDANADPDSHLGGFRRLRAGLKLRWDLYFFPRTDVELAGVTPTPHQRMLNHSMRIDPHISKPLFALPEGLAPPGQSPHRAHSLPSLNLHRGRALGLPAGPDVAHAMGIEPLDFEQLLPLGTAAATVSAAARDALRAAPLWYYVLCEAATDLGNAGRRLGPVGGRIVAEVLVGLLEADPHSYLRQWPTWKPGFDAPVDDFTMLDLIRFTHGVGSPG
jgi:hypothetical protein